MNLSELIVPEGVRLCLSSRTKSEVIEELADLLQAAHPVEDRLELIAALLERESIETTGIGSSIALPHAKTPAVGGLHVVFGRSAVGIDYASLDGTPARLFFLIVSPPDSTGPHIQALASISRLLRSPGVRERLLEVETVPEFLEVLRGEDARRAALGTGAT